MLAVIVTVVQLLVKILGVLQTPQVRRRIEEIRNDREIEKTRKILAAGDSRSLAVLLQSRHDRVRREIYATSGARPFHDREQVPAGPAAAGQPGPPGGPGGVPPG